MKYKTRCPHCRSVISESALACRYCKLLTARGWRVLLAALGIVAVGAWLLLR